MLLLLFSVVAALLFGAQTAHADDVIPPAPQLPLTFSLADALKLFRKQGLDLLIAEANTKNAEGGVKIAGAVPNPVMTTSVGNAITYSNSSYSKSNCLVNGAACSPWVYNLGVSDSAAIEDFLSGKRDLRLKVALNALASAKMTRADTERMLVFLVKSDYVAVAQAVLDFKFSKDIAASNAVTLKKFQALYKFGKIDEGVLQRIETQKLESDQALDNAVYTVRAARVALAFILGVRGAVPDFDVDDKVLDFSVPPKLDNATEAGLVRMAFDHRPDLLALGYQLDSAAANVDLTKRKVFPDIAFGVNYSWGGFGGLSTNGPVGPQILTFSLSVPLPVFYQLDGEILQAEAFYDASALQRAKTTAQVVNDVSTGLAQFVAARKLVERMEGPRRDGGGLLESATGAFNTTALQYDKGAATFMDYLDALRTYIAINIEYHADLANYWTAVYQLEQAVGMELR